MSSSEAPRIIPDRPNADERNGVVVRTFLHLVFPSRGFESISKTATRVQEPIPLLAGSTGLPRRRHSYPAGSFSFRRTPVTF